MRHGPLDIQPGVRSVLAALWDAGYQAYIVGGAVRDLALDLTPKDYDIATAATPEQVRDLFGNSAKIIGRRFRLVHLYRGRTYYEISTFRREPTAEERCSRATDDGVMLWQDNQYGTLEQDARRRDFTVNALYYAEHGDSANRILDFCTGLADMESGTVRAIGEPRVRVAEDPVRMLRAVKLVAEYGFTLDEGLEAALREFGDHFGRSSQARLYEELLKITAKPFALATFEQLQHHGLLRHFLPNLAAGWNSPAGQLMRQLMAERDRRSAAGSYSRSRALALATMGLPFAAEALGVGGLDGLWEHTAGLERTVRESLRNQFAPLPTPKVLTARARDVILMLPRFYTTAHRKRLLNYQDYRYARELFSLATAVRGWPKDIIDQWPVSGHMAPGPARDRHRQKHVRRSHRKHWENR